MSDLIVTIGRRPNPRKLIPLRVRVPSLQEASKTLRAFIEKYDIGSSQFSGGDVFDADSDKQVARISYNGRIWDMNGKEIV